ncbi:response regulator [Larkinella terrae]|uniref:Response regulator n=1 Tax=Larkinella terrae TaxID=2025311 RepID=A0A7K0EU27_9BACT|nr:response regulator [Larkinella terrae]MRS65315.1 response regulator [Larkinella terrae]
MIVERSIYIVDDHADFRFILKQLFSMAVPRSTTRLFENGQALLDGLNQSDALPVLILMDCHMPVLDGYQTILQLKQSAAYRHIPVVMMSSEADSSEIRNLYRAGANSFIRKPIEFTAQMELVAQLGKYWLDTNLIE